MNIGITQRVDDILGYCERRDSLDQRWTQLIVELGHLPVPLPNVSAKCATQMIDQFGIDALILSGGNTIAALDTDATDVAPERDQIENTLIDIAVNQKLPLLGVCRGMQMLNLYFDGQLYKTTGHVATRHALNVQSSKYSLPAEVNSFHNYAIARKGLGQSLQALAYDEDENVEAFCHVRLPLLGMMWHPERELPFAEVDVQLIKKFIE